MTMARRSVSSVARLCARRARNHFAWQANWGDEAKIDDDLVRWLTKPLS